uniref:Uncharacterized protein n=1 Tax=Equus caballus TaxID=9796 RepID=A0A9L0SBB6_HORSE
MILQANGKQKKAGVAIRLSDKIDFKIEKITRDKEGRYITIKGTLHQEDIRFINIYAPNTGAAKYIKQLLIDLKGDINGNTRIVGDHSTPLTSIDTYPDRKSTTK